MTTIHLARWTARTLTVGLIVLFAAFGLGEGLPPLWPMSWHTVSATLLLVSLVGLMFAFRWELAGGLAALVGAVGFYGVDFAVSGFRGFPSGWVFPLLLVTPLLFLRSWQRRYLRYDHWAACRTK